MPSDASCEITIGVDLSSMRLPKIDLNTHTVTGRWVQDHPSPGCDCVTCLLLREPVSGHATAWVSTDNLPVLLEIKKLRRRAGVKNDRVPVLVVNHGMIPPTLRRSKHPHRQVMVSVDWLQKKALPLWAKLCALRMETGRSFLAPYRKET